MGVACRKAVGEEVREGKRVEERGKRVVVESGMGWESAHTGPWKDLGFYFR